MGVAGLINVEYFYGFVACLVMDMGLGAGTQ
jgi:hypothetical protein